MTVYLNILQNAVIMKEVMNERKEMNNLRRFDKGSKILNRHGERTKGREQWRMS